MRKRLLCAALACSVSVSIPPVLAAEPERGLLLHYGFKDMTSDGIAVDESGNGNDGRIFGNAVTEYGRIRFDGEDDYIEMPDGLLAGTDEVTVAVNLCPEFDTLHYFAWNFGTSSSEGYMFLNTSRPDKKLRFAITPASADRERELASDNDIKKGTQSSVIVTIREKAGVMYRDGEKVAEGSFDISPSELGRTVQNWIGRSPYGDALMKGYVDDFRVYNYALSAEDAKALSDEYRAETSDPLTAALRDCGLKSIIKQDIALPTEAGGMKIEWSSSDESVISSGGSVTSPQSDYAATVTLTAKITGGDKTETKTFTVSVPPKNGGTYGLKITGERGADINPGMVGLFFEDINYAADGGLYAEMIENRSFESQYVDNRTFEHDYDSAWAWSVFSEGGGNSSMDCFASDSPLNENNPHYLRFATDGKNNGFSNAAYDGLTLKKDMIYHGSFCARSAGYSGSVTVSARDAEDYGRKLAETKVNLRPGGWTRYEYELTASEDARGALFVITLDEAGDADFDMISLMPSDAVRGVFRRDLAEMLKAINPGFLRFPGGCVIEGYDLGNRYNWKDSIGAIEERKENWNRWALHTDGYNHYNQTLGLGFYEYFELCEYLECEAIPVVNVGMACQFQTNETVPIESAEFKQYVQDALDLIEFANDDISTKYGAIRAEMGHPEPFGLTMLGIGNEQWTTEENRFAERYDAFERAIHEKYPDIKLIGTTGPAVENYDWRAAWSRIREKKAQNDNYVCAVDEHYYMTPQWFLQNTDFYDDYDREVFVFAGEYASRTRNLPNDPEANTLYTALTEAAYFTGLERNSDVVKMSCYAPLFARVGRTQWSPDLIWFDSASAYGSPSWYVQKMNSNNLGDYNVGYEVRDGSNDTGIFSNVCYDEERGELIIKLVNATSEKRSVKTDINGYRIPFGAKACVTTLGTADADKNASNSIENPENVSEAEAEPMAASQNMTFSAEPYTYQIIRIGAAKAETIEALAEMTEAERAVLTRGELMRRTALASAGYDSGESHDASFTDLELVNAGTANAIGFMEAKGIVEGYDDKTFKPLQIITREEFDIVMSRLKNNI